MERIVFWVRQQEPKAVLRQLDEFVRSIEHLPIAEDRFGRPIVIFGTSVAIPPFWRDLRKAPPLFKKKTYKGDEAINLMSRGH